jgi:selenocysteine lyase/cysteine desulfurase
VQRPAGEPLPSWASVINSSVKSHGVASDGSHFTAGAKVTVRLPNGSVRASLGYMSRFEDVYALVDWLYKRYVLQHAFVSMHSLQ